MISNGSAFRYRIHHKEGIIKFINDINGIFYNPVRIKQFEKLCNLYNIKIINSPILHYSSAYLSGLFDSNGNIIIDFKTNQVIIIISQKNRELLDIISTLYGGVVYSDNNTAYK
jgi:hypothetical protein